MKYCYNMTFLVQAGTMAQQLDWITRRVEHLRRSPSFTGTDASVAQVLAVPGMGDYGRDETSVTAQFEFDDRDAATAWGNTHFAALAGAFSKKFGQRAYVMPSIISMRRIS